MDINSTVALYLAAKDAESAANKAARAAKARADELAADIIRHAGGAASFSTDAYAVGISRTASIILDTDKLYRDFPGIKDLDQYGKESPRVKITAVPLAAAETASA